MAVNIPAEFDFARLTMKELEELQQRGPIVVMLPVGAIEPHGPHLGLYTDIAISQAAAIGAAAILVEKQVTALIAPPVPYGVTRCASAFRGAIHVEADALTAFLHSAILGFLNAGVSHVCLINNHLEPEHISAVYNASEGIRLGAVSVACPVSRRWARTLSDEFRSGACHAGRYETSIVMAADPGLVREQERAVLPEVPISLSDKLGAGVSDFEEMGLSQAYAGTPAAASAEHGREQIGLLAKMVASEITDAMTGA